MIFPLLHSFTGGSEVFNFVFLFPQGMVLKKRIFYLKIQLKFYYFIERNDLYWRWMYANHHLHQIRVQKSFSKFLSPTLMKKASNKTAVVIGGSMAGLLATRVLSDHFHEVILIESDKMKNIPESRKGQPQTRHVHVLLARGFQVMSHYFPDLSQSVKREGGLVVDLGQNMRWYCYGGYRQRFDLGVEAVISDRTFLECHIRKRVVDLPNVKVLDGFRVDKLLSTDEHDHITGVKIKQQDQQDNTQTLLTDLVIDCSGRSSKSAKWLAELGYPKAPKSVVTCGTGYTTRLYQRNTEESGSKDWVFITPEAPKEYRGGGVFPIEGNRWIVSLGGWHGNHAPKDEAGFLEFARSLPAPDIYDIIRRSKPLSDFSIYKYPASTRHHYEKIKNFPQRYLIIGDALCSFNPLYGQGMTSAALQAATLDRLLQERDGSLEGISKIFFKRAAKIVAIPWQTAVGEDFRFPETGGRKPPGTDLINAYTARIHRVTHYDAVVGLAFFKVLNMIKSPVSLFHPRILWRVLFSKKAKA
ncbi:monooxygenase FAD-binding protein [Flammeovirgaceae bacterium 311]|nr:monooxygenase FAD-binding protein [Flammeovirgaceae bacterium 311]